MSVFRGNKFEWGFLIVVLVVAVVTVFAVLQNKNKSYLSNSAVEIGSHKPESQNNSDPQKAKILANGGRSDPDEQRIKTLVSCILDSSCVESESPDHPYFDVTSSPSYLELRDLLNGALEKQDITPSAKIPKDQLLEALRIADPQIQIVASQWLLRDRNLNQSDVGRFALAFESFESASATTIGKTLFELESKKDMAKELTRKRIVAMTSSWLAKDNNSPIEMLQDGFLKKLNTEELDQLAKALCRFKTNSALSHARPAIENVVSLKACETL
jgi:hypothetical protein